MTGYIKSTIETKKKSFYRFRPQTLKRHVNFKTRSRLEENKLDLPGMMFDEFPARIYPSDARLTHVLGYLRSVTDETKKLLSENYTMGDLYGFSGIEKVYEIGRLFRNEGIDHDHNPEFTTMESYESYEDYNTVMKMVEDMVSTVAKDVNGSTKIKTKDGET